MEKPYSKLGHEPCRLLRWKGMFIDVESDPTVPASNDQIYWCAETLTCLGPDGQVAAPVTCSPDRRCYDELTDIKLT